jgi:hypothetical protein
MADTRVSVEVSCAAEIGAVAVVLDPDVASAFPTPASVNAAPRSLLPNGVPRRP